ncbi:hypothetical protein PFISCL1PPCAC_1131, partial [Pristionchus fissidentatus]
GRHQAKMRKSEMWRSGDNRWKRTGGDDTFNYPQPCAIRLPHGGVRCEKGCEVPEGAGRGPQSSNVCCNGSNRPCNSPIYAVRCRSQERCATAGSES